MHCSGVSMLLYLVKHSCPNVADLVQEVSKILNCAYPVAFREMLDVIKFVLNTK